MQLFAVLPHEPEIWMPEFHRCWPAWKAALKSICRRYGLSAAVYERLAIELVHGSQSFAGFRQLLRSLRPAAILTEYDRNSRWSCLVLAARSLDIPTFTLQHGVTGRADACIGYVPLVADKIFCWGEMARDALLPLRRFARAACAGRMSAAQSGTCGRALLRANETWSGRGEAGRHAGHRTLCRVGTHAARGNVRGLHGTHAGGRGNCPLASVGDAGGVSRAGPIAPGDSFFRQPLQASILTNRWRRAVDVVVVHNSGVGSDALVKGRLAIVVDLPPSPLGHGRDLVDQAGCPCAKTADELLAAVRSLLFDDAARRRRRADADRFVERFCAHFGRDSARQIARSIEESVAPRKPPVASDGSRSTAKQETTV